MLATSRDQLVLYLMLLTCPMLVKTDVLLYSDAGVVVQGEESSKRHNREKRQVTKDIQGFNKGQQQAILQRHNSLRILPKASDMLKMTWDPHLENLAQNYSTQCNFQHNANRYNVPGFKSVGENLYLTTGTFDPAGVIQAWYDEVKDYDYNSGKCKSNKLCGHYTQIVWAGSKAVGCGVKYCKSLRGIDSARFPSGYLVVCNYGPSGNIIGRKPYATGEPCSKCPKETKFCVQGLCAERPLIGSKISLALLPASGNSSPPSQLLVFTIVLQFLVLCVHIK